MKKTFIFPIVVTVIVVGLVTSHRSEAQTKRTAVYDLTFIERMERLVAELDASGQTNIITKVSDIISARDMAETMHDTSTTVALLEQLRLGHTNEVIGLLEKQLDGDLNVFGAMTNEIHEAELNVLKKARDYRTTYPHKAIFPYTDAALAKTFELLDKK